MLEYNSCNKNNLVEVLVRPQVYSDFTKVFYYSTFYDLGPLTSPDSELTSDAMNLNTFVCLLGWEIGPWQGLFLYRIVQHRKVLT